MGIPREIAKGSFYDDSEDKEESPKRKRGAPLGNQNARRHGFYSKYLSDEQRKELAEALEINNPYEEIALLRVRLNSIIANPETPPDLLIRTMNAFTKLIAIERRFFWS